MPPVVKAGAPVVAADGNGDGDSSHMSRVVVASVTSLLTVAHTGPLRRSERAHPAVHEERSASGSRSSAAEISASVNNALAPCSRRTHSCWNRGWSAVMDCVYVLAPVREYRERER